MLESKDVKDFIESKNDAVMRDDSYYEQLHEEFQDNDYMKEYNEETSGYKKY